MYLFFIVFNYFASIKFIFLNLQIIILLLFFKVIKIFILKMSNFKCFFCLYIFVSHNRLTQHMNICVDTANEVKPIVVNNSAQIHSISNLSKLKQKESEEINEIEIDRDFSSKKISFKDIVTK